MKHIVYHGTREEYAYSLMKEGFRLDNIVYGRGAGNGVYTSRYKSFAAYWGDVLIVCELKESIRLVQYDTYDPKIIDSLTREFGAAIKKPDFWKILPRNKQFKKHEIVELWRYYMKHYFRHQKNDKNYPILMKNLTYIYTQLRYHQFDGFEIPDTDWPEMVVFNPAHIRPLSAHTILHNNRYENDDDFTDSLHPSLRLSEALSLDELKEIQDSAIKENEDYASFEYDEERT